MTTEERGQLETVLGHCFKHSDGLERALTHRSHRQNSESVDNERLEFLGDRVVGLVVSEHLFQVFPDWDAGKLSKGLAQLVSTPSIHAAAKRLDIWDASAPRAGRRENGWPRKETIACRRLRSNCRSDLPRRRTSCGRRLSAPHFD